MTVGWSGRNIGVRRGGNRLLDGVTVELKAGAVTVLLGPNGSGKTTLLQVLAGLLKPDEGGVDQASELWKEPEWARAVACSFGPAAEEIPFCVEEILLSSRFPDGGRWLDPSDERRAPLVAVLERLEVFPEAVGGLNRAYGTLSTGERQLIDIARAVLQDTPVLLLDEPSSALDLRHRLLAAELLRDEARRGRTVVLSEHDLAEAGRFEEAVVLKKGRVAAAGPVGGVLTDALLADVWGVAQAGGGLRLL